MLKIVVSGKPAFKIALIGNWDNTLLPAQIKVRTEKEYAEVPSRALCLWGDAEKRKQKIAEGVLMPGREIVG